MIKFSFNKANTEHPTKADQVETLLRRAEGVSLKDMAQATGWQPHSCRAFLTGLRKKEHNIVRAKRKDNSSYYRICPNDSQEPKRKQQSIRGAA